MLTQWQLVVFSSLCCWFAVTELVYRKVVEMFWGAAGQRGCVGLLRCWSLTVRSRSLTTPQCPLHTSRSFSISAPSKCPTHEEVNQPLKQWALEVSPYSTVRAQLACSISVRPLDVHAFPEGDRAFITVHGTDAEQEVGLDHLHVHYDDQSKELLISAGKVHSSVSIDLAAPIKSSECLLWNDDAIIDKNDLNVYSAVGMMLFLSPGATLILCFCQISSSALTEEAVCKWRKWSVTSARCRQRRATVCYTLSRCVMAWQQKRAYCRKVHIKTSGDALICLRIAICYWWSSPLQIIAYIIASILLLMQMFDCDCHIIQLSKQPQNHMSCFFFLGMSE